MKARCVRGGLAVCSGVLLLSGFAGCSAGDQQEIQNRANQVANEAVKKGAEEAKKTAGDYAITGAVKAKLVQDATAKATAIGVTTENGVVTLSGSVECAEAKANAEAVARGADGVTSVVNNLTVMPAAQPPGSAVAPAAGKNAKR
jgi:osmotically-inducible protein OsmY